MIFLDAHGFLRTLTYSDDPAVQRASGLASALFTSAERGEAELTTSDAVLAEVALILTAKSYYGLPVREAASSLAPLTASRGLRLIDKRAVMGAFELWSEYPRLGFVDVLTAAYAQSPGMRLATFDSDFDELPEIDRWQSGEAD